MACRPARFINGGRRFGSEQPQPGRRLSAVPAVRGAHPPLKKHILNAPRLWGYLGAGQRQENGLWVDHPPAVLFEFAESREAVHPLTFLADYKGYLQADAYSGYLALYRTGRVIEVGCRAPCRRRFFEIAKIQKTPGLAAQALAWIARLYAIETSVKDASPDHKHAARQAQAVPLLANLRSWLEGHVPQLLPQSPLAQAFGYALRNWTALVRYTENGCCPIIMPWSGPFVRSPLADPTTCLPARRAVAGLRRSCTRCSEQRN